MRCSFSRGSHKFATFVAFLSIIGIAIGVGSLIVVSSIMGGLQGKLKAAVLKTTAQVIVDAPLDKAKMLLSLPNVYAVAPYIEGQVLLQCQTGIGLVNIQGNDLDNAVFAQGFDSRNINLGLIPSKGSYELNAQTKIFTNFNLRIGEQVRLISTKNARYTPVGRVPSQRKFVLVSYTPSVAQAGIPEAIGNYDDVRRLLRYKEAPQSLRLWLTDPFLVQETINAIDKLGLNHEDWREKLGEFFKAVALEKLSMSVMLTLIIMVAAFNILSALTMTVGARLNDIAVLKTLGLRSSQILKIFVTIGTSYGFLGSFIGTVLGIPATFLIAKIMSNSMGTPLPVNINILSILTIFLGSLFLTLICTLYPALKAAKTDPVLHLARG